jgi:hypothetical protein
MVRPITDSPRTHAHTGEVRRVRSNGAQVNGWVEQLPTALVHVVQY